MRRTIGLLTGLLLVHCLYPTGRILSQTTTGTLLER